MHSTSASDIHAAGDVWRAADGYVWQDELRALRAWVQALPCQAADRQARHCQSADAHILVSR
jgi:hypothetical protein